MRTPFRLGAVMALLVLLAMVAMGAARTIAPGFATHAVMIEVVPTGRPSQLPSERPDAHANPDQARIKALDQQIASLREQFKSQADPLQAQVKALREKLDADLKPLEDERHDLVERAKLPAIRDLDADEATQLASLADHEKADVAKVHEEYAQQRTTLKASFDQKRRELRSGDKR